MVTRQRKNPLHLVPIASTCLERSRRVAFWKVVSKHGTQLSDILDMYSSLWIIFHTLPLLRPVSFMIIWMVAHLSSRIKHSTFFNCDLIHPSMMVFHILARLWETCDHFGNSFSTSQQCHKMGNRFHKLTFHHELAGHYYPRNFITLRASVFSISYFSHFWHTL